MLFGKSKTIEVRKPADFDSVTDYLTGLSVEDYTKLNKVVEIRRSAQRDCNAILGLPNEPTTFIDPANDEPEFLDLLSEPDSSLSHLVNGKPKKVSIKKTPKPKAKK